MHRHAWRERPDLPQSVLTWMALGTIDQLDARSVRPNQAQLRSVSRRVHPVRGMSGESFDRFGSQRDTDAVGLTVWAHSRPLLVSHRRSPSRAR
jgi:hypothetical protein